MKDKKIFEEPKLEIIGISTQDVIVSSEFPNEQQNTPDTPEVTI